MRRYRTLTETDIYEALNRVRDAFLAAKDGEEVNHIINGLLTPEERIQIGRRIIIAECLSNYLTHQEIAHLAKVGRNTINAVYKNLALYPECFELIFKRKKKVEKEYLAKKYKEKGGSKLIFKKKEYSGFKRKNIQR